tara:strand:- start:234 stop:341 length:108 start_codon:yes stop_codon:yes gene_type:complete
MESVIGFIIFAAVAGFAFRKKLVPLYNKYFGTKNE